MILSLPMSEQKNTTHRTWRKITEHLQPFVILECCWMRTVVPTGMTDGWFATSPPEIKQRPAPKSSSGRWFSMIFPFKCPLIDVFPWLSHDFPIGLEGNHQLPIGLKLLPWLPASGMCPRKDSAAAARASMVDGQILHKQPFYAIFCYMFYIFLHYLSMCIYIYIYIYMLLYIYIYICYYMYIYIYNIWWCSIQQHTFFLDGDSPRTADRDCHGFWAPGRHGPAWWKNYKRLQGKQNLSYIDVPNSHWLVDSNRGV